MKALRTVTILALALVAIPALAATTWLKTLPQAEAHCPAINALLFTPMLSSPTSAGVITGANNTTFFTSTSSTVLHPKSLSAKNMVQGVQFRKMNDAYGYIINHRTVCFYTYPGFTPVTVYLNMKSVN